MNQKCSVCNEPAAGFHFGAFTCEGCKSFFGRTYNNADIVSRCRNGGNCEINKKSRTSCKACRMRKCLEVGMSKSSSRYGRRSNMFKMNYRLLVETENTQNERPHIAPSYNLLPPKPQSWGDDEIDAASTSQTNSAKYANDATNSHNNEFPLHNWNNQEPQLPTTPPPSTSNQVTSSLTDNQIQRQNPMQYPPPLTRYYRPPLMESRPRSTSNNSEEEHLDVESRSSSSRVSPFTPNRVNESSALSIVAVDLMFMSAQSTINSLIHSIPNIITPEAFMMRSGGLADEPNEPIDLSMRASDSSSQSSESSEKKSDKENQINDSDSSSTEESAANPLDLTFNTTPLKLNFKF